MDKQEEWGDIVQEMIDWNYGTIHKQYDRDETCEVLEEDTRKYCNKLKDLRSKDRDTLIENVWQAVGKVGTMVTDTEWSKGYNQAMEDFRKEFKQIILETLK
jgi:hypothetical protein